MPSNTVIVNNLSLGRKKFVRTDRAEVKMDIDGRATGTALIVWNGTGALDTGGDWARSGIGSESADAMKSGTNGLDTGLTDLDDTVVFTNSGGDIDVAGTYAALSMWVKIKEFPCGSKFKLYWKTNAGVLKGATLDLENYINEVNEGSWVKLIIPIVDFQLDAHVAKLFLDFGGVADQKHYIDDVELLPSGGDGPYIFQVCAPAGEIHHIESITLLLAAGDSNWKSSNFGDIEGGLEGGLILRHLDKSGDLDEVLWSVTFCDNVDMWGNMDEQSTNTFSNNKTMVVWKITPTLSSVDVTEDKVLQFVVRDDLSSLNKLRAFVNYGVEVGA